MLRIGDGFEELVESRNTADVLERATPGTIDEPRVARHRIDEEHLLDLEPMLPAVTHVVKVGEALDAASEIVETDASGAGGARPAEPCIAHAGPGDRLAADLELLLVAGSDLGGARAAAIYSLIETAKLNGLDPQSYLAAVLARLPDHPMRRVAELLPWKARARQSRSMSDAVLRPKITLVGTEPPIWRRVEVPAELTLKDLHSVIQAAMGWENALKAWIDLRVDSFEHDIKRVLVESCFSPRCAFSSINFSERVQAAANSVEPPFDCACRCLAIAAVRSSVGNGKEGGKLRDAGARTPVLASQPN